MNQVLSEKGLVVKPEIIEFYDVFYCDDETVSKTVTFINRGKRKIILKILEPYSWVFQVEDDGTPIFLPPGLSVTRKIIYTFAHDLTYESKLPFILNNEYYCDIPIRVKKTGSKLTVSPKVLNFGIIDLGCRFVAQYLILSNSGSYPAKFAIDFGSNKLDLLATPKQGIVTAYGTVLVKIEMAGFIAGELFDEFWVKSDPPSRVEVEVHVMFPYLQAIHPNTTGDFTLIDFKPTFFGTERYETFVVQNVSSFPSCFVVLAEINNKLYNIAKARDRKFVYTNFIIRPIEGMLGPFEGRIFTITFKPHSKPAKEKGWKHLKVDDLEFLCFIRVLRVDVADWQDDEEENLFKSKSGRTTAASGSDITGGTYGSDTLRICLHGDGAKPELKVVPDCLYYEDVEVGKEYRKVLRLTNLCNTLPIGYKYRKTVDFFFDPPSNIIEPRKSFEVTVIFRVSSIAKQPKSLPIELNYYHDLTDMKNLITISEVHVGVRVSIKVTTIKPEPKFITGITPFVAHETGLLTETLQYKDLAYVKTPKAMNIPKRGFQDRPWLRGEDHIAFPNDMPHSFRVKKLDPKMKSIFTGVKRYVPPVDGDYAYTEEEQKVIDERNEEIRQFCNHRGHIRREIITTEENDIFGKKSPSDERLSKLVEMKVKYKYEKEFADICRKKPPKPVILNEICPVTATQLYNIRVMPKNLDFGKIPPDVDCVKVIRIDNFNNFSVTIKLLLQNSKMKEQVFVVPGRSRNEKEITLNLKNYGKYYSNVSYVVNNSHSFDLKLTAEVIQRTLSVMPAELVISPGRNQYEDLFQVKWSIIKVFNPLYVPTKFKWEVPSGVPFRVEPKEGVIPGNRCIACAAYYDLHKKTKMGTTLQLVVHDGDQIPVRVYLTDEKKHSVTPLIAKRILPPISLNLPYTEKSLIFNAGFKDVLYSVVNPHPIDGVTIHPIVGIIPARACIGLSLEFKLTKITAFDFTLELELQGYDVVETKCIGYVVFPKVDLNPKRLVLRSTPCFSQDTFNLHLENGSPALAQVQFPLQNYPQIKISRSKNFMNPGVDDEGVIIQPKASLDLFFHFLPKDLATYEFYLPIVLNKIIGPPILNNEDSMKPETYIKIDKDNMLHKYFNLECPEVINSIYVDCSVPKGYLEFSDHQFKFDLHVRGEVEQKSITVKNITKSPLTIFMDTLSLVPTPFTVVNGPTDRKHALRLEPNTETKITMEFKPLFPSVFTGEIPLHINEYSESVAYTTIPVKGTLPKSVLYCPTNLVHFIPVPVNVAIERRVEVIATHQYRETTLICFMRKIMGEYQGDDVFEYIFPKGNKIPMNHEPVTIPLIIKFKSKKPTSFRGSIVISDEQDGQCMIYFTVCADNTTMTNHIYLFIRDQACTKKGEKMSPSLDTIGRKESDICIEKISQSQMSPDILEEILEYPKFPKRTSSSRYACYMRRILQTMEQWIYEQGFRGSFRMVLGDHVAFSKAFVSATHARSKNSNYECIRSIIDLMLNFVGRELFLQYQLPPNVPEDDAARIGHSLGIFKQIIQFIRVQGGNASHIFPVYLLHYEDYVYYYNEVKMRHLEKSKKGGIPFQDLFDEKCSTKIFLPEEEFERYNLLAWLDIALQIHKTIIQAAVPYRSELKLVLDADSSPGTPKSPSPRLRSPSCESYDMAQARLVELVPEVKKTGIERPERILLMWLNAVYAGMKHTLVQKHYIWPERIITNLHEDLKDGVVLCAVTLFYCPYLEELYFQDFYFTPTESAQYHHNSVILATAWNAIRLGITVLPSDFHNLNPIFLMILVCHLYCNLRTYVPQTTIQFLSCLSQSVIRKISVINSNTTPIGYAIKILGDSNGSFSLENFKQALVLSSKSSVTVPISYMAKTITPVKAVLLLCGTYLPMGYANNMVFSLVGEPYKLTVASELIINTPIYRTTFINAIVVSPYYVEGEYDVWYTETEPEPGNIIVQKWSIVRQLKIPRTLYIGCNSIFVPPVNAMHPAVLPLTAACFSLTAITFWLILRNREIGDFIIKVTVQPRIENPFLILPVKLPVGTCTGFPNARCSLNCPRTFTLYIPCRSARLWATVKSMFLLTLEKKEHPFWEEHLETRIGLELIKWLLGDRKVCFLSEINYLFASKNKYSIKSLTQGLEVDPFVFIEDVHSPGFESVMAHACCKFKTGTKAEIMLESECGKEVRYYQIRFTEPTEPIQDTEVSCRKCVVPLAPKIQFVKKNRNSANPEK